MNVGYVLFLRLFVTVKNENVQTKMSFLRYYYKYATASSIIEKECGVQRLILCLECLFTTCICFKLNEKMFLSHVVTLAKPTLIPWQLRIQSVYVHFKKLCAVLGVALFLFFLFLIHCQMARSLKKNCKTCPLLLNYKYLDPLCLLKYM